jgi:pimeloyl-ACP methyl ester carboxylesterase
MLALVLVAVLLVGGWLFQQAGDGLDARRYPPPGQRLAVPGGANLHVYEQGSPSAPTVVFEAGISGSSLSWSNVQPLVARFAHSVAYDRAGLGWSDGALTPRTVANMVSELAAALDAGKITPPYLLAAHSFGCLLIRAFASTYPDRTAALIMVDPVTIAGWVNPDPQQLRRLNTGARLSRRGALLARFGVVRAALSLLVAGGTRIPKLLARASAGQGNSVIERLIGEVRKLPVAAQPIVGSHWSRSRSFTAMAAYLECLPSNARAAVAMPVPSQIPMIILSADTATEAELAERTSWIAGREHAQHIQVPGTGHWLQLERPELVAGIVRDTLLRVR